MIDLSKYLFAERAQKIKNRWHLTKMVKYPPTQERNGFGAGGIQKLFWNYLGMALVIGELWSTVSSV